jgi:DNA-binding transcriptional regulator YiaG
MTKEAFWTELDALRRQLELSYRKLARRIGTSPTNVCRWLGKHSAPSPLARRAIIDRIRAVAAGELPAKRP